MKRAFALLFLLLTLALPARATITTTTVSQTFQGNGATTVFTFSFVAGQAAWITVTFVDASGNITVLNTSQYTLAIAAPAVGACWGIGGTVTYNPAGTPIASGTQLVVSRTVPVTQTTSVSNQAAYVHAVECAMDQIVMQTQQLTATYGLFPLQAVPVAPPRGGWIIYADTADSKLKAIAHDGTIVILGTP